MTLLYIGQGKLIFDLQTLEITWPFVYLSKKTLMHFARWLVLFFTIHYSPFTFSQTDSCSLHISLLTCSPGAELYSIFGHSALRVVDNSTGTDIVYNYGTFDFNDPQFYSKFVRGKLLYYLTQENFSDFRYDYMMESRGIIEQQLNLSCKEKKQFQEALFINLQGDNKFYKYDFLFDNCTTRLRDLAKSSTDSGFNTSNILPGEKTSFRNLIHYYLNKSKMYWSKLGIDLLLGSKPDRQITNEEAMFLPDYLEKGFDYTRSGNNPLVTEKQTILSANPLAISVKTILSPQPAFYILLLIFLAASFLKTKWAKAFLRIGDFILFLTTGLLGVLMVFMWTGTDHVVCKNNFNLLWAMPTHVMVAFFLNSAKTWKKKYLLFATIINALLLICWWLLPQDLNMAMIPFVILLAWRSWQRAKQ